MKKPRTQSGFTLLEVILSISLLALIALMVARIFSDSTKAVEQGKRFALMDESARVLLDLLERDIGQALIRTDVPFRVETTDEGEFSKLYFISTGMRRQLETMPRDTAPMLIWIDKRERWNQQLVITSPYGSAGSDRSHRYRLMQQSDYYIDDPAGTAGDFTAFDSGATMRTGDYEQTELLDSTASDYAMLTSFNIVVNGDPNWTGGAPSGLPSPGDMPRFVDIAVGLTPSTIVRQARTLDQNINKNGLRLVQQNERVFTRRIFFPNTGTHGLTL